MTERQQARKTALVVGAVFLALAAWSLWRAHPLRAQAFGAAGGVLILLGALAPHLAIPFHRAWMKAAAWLGWINSRIILGVMYYGVMTPVGLLTRLLGRDPLRRRRISPDTHWVTRPKTRQQREGFERLF